MKPGYMMAGAYSLSSVRDLSSVMHCCYVSEVSTRDSYCMKPGHTMACAEVSGLALECPAVFLITHVETELKHMCSLMSASVIALHVTLAIWHCSDCLTVPWPQGVTDLSVKWPSPIPP